MSNAEELRVYVEAFCHTAFGEPQEGRTFWSFITRDQPESLSADQVLERLEKGQGAFLIELVWDEDLNILERGEGRVVHGLEDLKSLADSRLRHLAESKLTRDPGLAANAPRAEAGQAMPKSKTSTPWHPAMMPNDDQ
jgi:hypothetical protein